MRFIGVFNRNGGTFRALDMGAFIARAVAIFAEHGDTLECRVPGPGELVRELARAAEDPTADVVLAGGGDGTISAAAEICFRAGKPLAILPAGTMNFFARTLKIPLNLEEALKAIAGGSLREVDIATANGRAFVHQYSVGLHARLVTIREAMPYHSRWQKMLASFRAIFGAVSRPLIFQVEVRTPRGIEQRVASSIVVTNNLLGEGHMPHADDADGGVLGVYLAKPMPPREMIRLCAQVLIGRWKAHPRISEKQVTDVVLLFPKLKASAKAVIDGELIDLERRVELRIHPKALKVVAPASSAGTATAADRAETGPGIDRIGAG